MVRGEHVLNHALEQCNVVQNMLTPDHLSLHAVSLMRSSERNCHLRSALKAPDRRSVPFEVVRDWANLRCELSETVPNSLRTIPNLLGSYPEVVENDPNRYRNSEKFTVISANPIRAVWNSQETAHIYADSSQTVQIWLVLLRTV
jgi:hypothetical protein